MSEKKLIYADDLYDKVSSMGLQNGSALGHHSGTADVIAEMIQNAPAVDPASCLNWRTGKPPEHESWFAKFKDTEQWRFGMFETMSDEVLVTVEFPGGERYTTTAVVTSWVLIKGLSAAPQNGQGFNIFLAIAHTSFGMSVIS